MLFHPLQRHSKTRAQHDSTGLNMTQHDSTWLNMTKFSRFQLPWFPQLHSQGKSRNDVQNVQKQHQGPQNDWPQGSQVTSLRGSSVLRCHDMPWRFRRSDVILDLGMSWVRSGLVLDISVALLQGQLARATHQHPQARLQEIREA